MRLHQHLANIAATPTSRTIDGVAIRFAESGLAMADALLRSDSEERFAESMESGFRNA